MPTPRKKSKKIEKHIYTSRMLKAFRSIKYNDVDCLDDHKPNSLKSKLEMVRNKLTEALELLKP